MTEETQEREVQKISKHDFYFETPLYDVLNLDEVEDDFINGDVDGYSSILQDNTTYNISLKWITSRESSSSYDKKGYALITLTCKRKQNNVLRFFVYLDQFENSFVEKIGQDPSMADLQFSHLQIKYDKVLENKYLKEFKRAVGLASHGVGVGSFVYLRRIFENLISQTFEIHEKEISVDSEEFKTQHMEDKIDILKSFLPSQLVKMKSIYGILSKGIHELDDEICLTYFGSLKLSIELILDQKIEEKKKSDKDKLVDDQIKDIQQKIK